MTVFCKCERIQNELLGSTVWENSFIENNSTDRDMKSRNAVRRRMGGCRQGASNGRGARNSATGKGNNFKNGSGSGTDLLNFGRSLLEKISGSQRTNSPSVSENVSYQINDFITAEEQNTMSMAADIDTYRCIGCSLCVGICPSDAITVHETAAIDQGKCTGCGTCIEECPQGSISLVEI